MPNKIEQDAPQIGEVLHQWEVPEYEQHERNAGWYILMFSIGIGLVLYGILTGNFIFALIIILFAIILFLQSHQVPQLVPFKITDLGIIIGDRFYLYSELSGFYLIYQPPEVKTLYLDTKSFFRPLLRIPLLDNNPVEIRHALREFLTEDLEKDEEPAADRLARNWRLH